MGIPDSAYRTVFENTGTATAIIAYSGVILRVNEEFLELTGYSREESEGQLKWMALVDEGDLDRMLSYNAARIKDPRMAPKRYQFTLVCKNGARRSVRLAVDVIPGADSFVASVLDVSEYMAVTRALESERHRLSVTLQSIGDAVLATDADGTVDLMNAEAERLTGWSTEEALGLKASEVLELIDEDTGEALEDPVSRVLVDGKPVEMGRRTSLVSRDGQIHSIADSATPIDDGDGNVVGAVLVFRDVTEERMRGEQLRLMEFSLESSGLPTVWADSEGTIFNANKAACDRLEYSKDHLVGKGVEAIDPDFKERIRALSGERVPDARSVTFQTAVRTRTGRTFPAEVTASYFEYSGKGYSLAFVRDISDRLAFERRLEYMSYHDALTGLHNRAFFEEQLSRMDREGRLPLSVIIGDVNGLKLVNDAFGHYDGDKILTRIAEIIKDESRPHGYAFRWGGDEFAVILPETSADGAARVCEAIDSECARSEPDPMRLSIALGYSVKEDPDEDIKAVVSDAEALMYNRKLVDSQKIRKSVILSLRRTLAVRTKEDEDHGVRLQRLSLNMAELLGLPSRHCDDLSLLAVLHDLGKVAVRDDILSKPGPLTDEEWVEVRRHSEIGHRIAASSVELAHISDAILSHHEKWDGTGYPNGLKGEDIPLLARVIAIADAYDVMTSGRPYREAISQTEALNEISGCAGSHFDPRLVSVFLYTMNRGS